MFLSVLRSPGVLPVYLAGIVGRLPAGAIGLVLILRTREMTGSYAAGGAVAAAYAIALGIGAPLLGRAIDRRGQRGVLLGSAAWSGLTLGAFALLDDGAPMAVAIVVAALSGLAVPPLSPCQRALWSDAIAPRLRHSAYALDSVVFELVYISGPLVLIGLVGTWSLRAAVVASGLLFALGAAAFTLTRLSREWTPHPQRHADAWGPLRGAGVRTVLVMFTLAGLAIAAIEIGLAAFTEREGAEGAIAVMLALWGVGSMLGGLVFGHLAEPADPARRLATLMFVLAVSEVPLALAPDLVTMGVAVAIAGGMLAPAFSLAFRLLSEVAPPGTVTEAQTWIATGISAGIASGSAIGGWIVEHAGTRPAFWLAVAISTAAATAVASRVATLRQVAPAVAAPAAA